MGFTLIPFGYHPKKGTYLAISEVENGAKCGCVCPSCKVPLIARHPEKDIVWNFAHSSKAIYKEVREKCEYNFFLSLRMFCRQMMTDSFEMALPEYVRTLTKQTSTTKPVEVKHEFTVTLPSRVRLDNIQVEAVHRGVHVDFIATVKGHPLIIYLSHPGRALPEELLNTARIGGAAVIEINLLHLENDLSNKSLSAYTDILSFVKRDIAENTFSKFWRYHPREGRLEADAQVKLLDKVREKESWLNAQAHSASKRGWGSGGDTLDRMMLDAARRYHCGHCGKVWDKKEGYICPSCFKKYI